MRILLHPGFHKTGTSSLQRGLETLADRLAPDLRFLLTADVMEAARAARRYAAKPGAARLTQFSEALNRSLEAAALEGAPALLISAEDLAGPMPGTRGITSYDTAPALVLAATTTLATRFGAAARITVLCTTRSAQDWQRSVWYQCLRGQRLTDDFETYRPKLSRAAQLDNVVSAITEHVGRAAHVVACPIETCGAAPLGPLGVALDLLDISTDGLPSLRAHNVQPDGAAQELLALNRSGLDDTELAQAKRDVVRTYRTMATRTRP